MVIKLLWHDEPVGKCDLDLLSDKVSTAEFFCILAVFQQHDGIALGFRLLGDGPHRLLDLTKPLTVSIPANAAPSGKRRGLIRAELDGPGVHGFMWADLDGPGVHGRIRADLDGPGVHGRIRADLDGPGVHGRIRADLDGPGVHGRIRADLDGPGVHGRIRADLDGPGVHGRIRADLDGPGGHGFMWADLDGPGVYGRIRAELDADSLPNSWLQALEALLKFIAERDTELVQIFFGIFLRAGVEIGRPLLSPEAQRKLAEYMPSDQALSSVARRALQQNNAYFEQLITEQPRKAALALTEDVTRHMLASAPIEEDSPPREPVRLGVCTPRSVPVGSSFLMNFVAYAPELEELIAKQLTKRNPQAEPHLDSHRVAWQLGTEVRIHVYGSHLKVEPQRDWFVWNGEKEQVDFNVSVIPGAPLGQTLLKTDVYIEGSRLKRIWLPIEICVENSEEGVPEMSGVNAPVSAFVSYSSNDRPRVLDRIASLIIRTGMDVVMDCITLRPSQRWRSLIPDLILESDLLLLFWSQDAARSHWVEWEWQHALEHKGLSCIEIHPLVPYSVAKLPSQFNELHSGDPLMIYREFEMTQLKMKQDSAQPHKAKDG